MKSYLICHYFPHLMSMILYHAGLTKVKLIKNMACPLFFTSHKTQTNHKLKRHWQRSLRQKMNLDERHFGHLLHRSLCVIPPFRQVKGDVRSQEEGAAEAAFRGEQCSDSCYHSGQNQSLNWRTSPFTQDQLGSINGFGVDQLMAIIFRCFDSVCTDNPTHTSACAALWCNADVYIHVLVCILL